MFNLYEFSKEQDRREIQEIVVFKFKISYFV